MEKINKRWVLAKRPEGMPEDECWKLEEASINDLDESQILIKVMYLSIDPYMRGRILPRMYGSIERYITFIKI